MRMLKERTVFRCFVVAGGASIVWWLLQLWGVYAGEEISPGSHVGALIAACLCMAAQLVTGPAWVNSVLTALRDAPSMDKLGGKEGEGIEQQTDATRVGIESMCQDSPLGFDEWIETQSLSVQAAARSKPPGVYMNDGETGMVMGYRQDDEGKVWVRFVVPSTQQREVHINELEDVS